MSDINIGIVQFEIIEGEVDKNVSAAVGGIEKLVDSGADLILLPEMFTSGFDYTKLKEHSLQTPEIITSLQQIANQKNVIIAGSMPEFYNNKIYNTLYIIEKNGRIAGSYRKVHLFTLTDEQNHFKNGVESVVCKTSIGNIGLMICYDLRFPELCRKLTDNGAEIVIISAQWPSKRVEHWDTLIKARAIENQIYIAAANNCGKTSDLEFPGHSQIISPWGEVLAKAAGMPETINEKIDLEEITRVRETIPCLIERVYEAY